MIHIQMKENGKWKELQKNEYEQIKNKEKIFTWLDFHSPTVEEIESVMKKFHFHPTSIDECLDDVQRPKVEFFPEYTFIIAHSINEKMEASEINMFITDHAVITFHKKESNEIEAAYRTLAKYQEKYNTPNMLAHYILDSIVDNYFEILYRQQDSVNSLNDVIPDTEEINALLANVFEIRREIHKMRKSIFPMRDLLYRLSESQTTPDSERRYYRSVYHHLQRVCESIEELHYVSNDIRDNLLSMNSYETNQVMKTLTVITTIFMPLTLVAGIYGMNFRNMPELHWRYGYAIIMVIMTISVFIMLYWFKKKKWL